MTIDAPSLVEPLTRMSTLHEWLRGSGRQCCCSRSFRNNPAFTTSTS